MLSERASSRGCRGEATVRRRLDAPPRGGTVHQRRLCDYFVTVGSRAIRGTAECRRLALWSPHMRLRAASHSPSPSLALASRRGGRRALHGARQQGPLGRSGRLHARVDRRLRPAVRQAPGRLQLLHRLAQRLQLAGAAARGRRARELARHAVRGHRGDRPLAARPRPRRRRRLPRRPQPPDRRARPGRLPASRCPR